MANGTLEDAVQKMIDNAEKAVQVAAVLTSQQIKKDFEHNSYLQPFLKREILI